MSEMVSTARGPNTSQQRTEMRNFDPVGGGTGAVQFVDTGVPTTLDQEYHFAAVYDADGGGSTANVSVSENTTAVTTVAATDVDLDTPTYAVTGGIDQGHFNIHGGTGVLSFITAPDFDAAEKEYTTANAAVEGARAQLDEANLKLTETALVNPLNGIVQQRNIEVGTLVHSGSVGFVVANTGVVKVVFGVPDTVLREIKLGSDLTIHTDSLPNRNFDGKVTEIAPAADRRTRIFEVSVTVANADGALRPGMVAALDIGNALLAAGDVVLVPITAMVQAPGGGFALFVVETTAQGADVARLLSVETGQILGNRITVTGGVTPGMKVIVTGTAQVGDNQPVNVVP